MQPTRASAREGNAIPPASSVTVFPSRPPQHVLGAETSSSLGGGLSGVGSQQRRASLRRQKRAVNSSTETYDPQQLTTSEHHATSSSASRRPVLQRQREVGSLASDPTSSEYPSGGRKDVHFKEDLIEGNYKRHSKGKHGGRRGLYDPVKGSITLIAEHQPDQPRVRRKDEDAHALLSQSYGPSSTYAMVEKSSSSKPQPPPAAHQLLQPSPQYQKQSKKQKYTGSTILETKTKYNGYPPSIIPTPPHNGEAASLDEVALPFPAEILLGTSPTTGDASWALKRGKHLRRELPTTIESFANGRGEGSQSSSIETPPVVFAEKNNRALSLQQRPRPPAASSLLGYSGSNGSNGNENGNGCLELELEEDVADIAEEGSYRNTVLRQQQSRSSTNKKQRRSGGYSIENYAASSSLEDTLAREGEEERKHDAFWHSLQISPPGGATYPTIPASASASRKGGRSQLNHMQNTSNTNGAASYSVGGVREQYNSHQGRSRYDRAVHPHNNNNNNSHSSSSIHKSDVNGAGGGFTNFQDLGDLGNLGNVSNDSFVEDEHAAANIEVLRDAHGVSPAGSSGSITGGAGGAGAGRLLPNVPKRFVVPRISAQEFSKQQQQQQQRSVSFEDENNAVTHLGGLATSDSNGNSDENQAQGGGAIKEPADLIDIIGPAPDSTPCSNDGVVSDFSLGGAFRVSATKSDKMVMGDDCSDDVPFYQRDPSFFVEGLHHDPHASEAEASASGVLDTYSSLQRPGHRYGKERVSRRDDYTRQQADFVNTYGTYRPHNSRSLYRNHRDRDRDRDRDRLHHPAEYNNFATSFEDEFNLSFHHRDQAQPRNHRNHQVPPARVHEPQPQPQSAVSSNLHNVTSSTTSAYLDQSTNNVILPPAGPTPGAAPVNVNVPYQQQEQPQQQPYNDSNVNVNNAYQSTAASNHPLSNPADHLLGDGYSQNYSNIDHQSGYQQQRERERGQYGDIAYGSASTGYDNYASDAINSNSAMMVDNVMNQQQYPQQQQPQQQQQQQQQPRNVAWADQSDYGGLENPATYDNSSSYQEYYNHNTSGGEGGDSSGHHQVASQVMNGYGMMGPQNNTTTTAASNSGTGTDGVTFDLAEQQERQTQQSYQNLEDFSQSCYHQDYYTSSYEDHTQTQADPTTTEFGDYTYQPMEGSGTGLESAPFLGLAGSGTGLPPQMPDGTIQCGPVKISPSEITNRRWNREQFPLSVSMDRLDLEMNPPRDRWHLIYLTLILHGIGTLMPWNMFITAKELKQGDWVYMLNEYFVNYKLGKEYTDTTMPYATYFLQYVGFAAQIPNLVFNWINIFLNIGGNLTSRIVWTLLIEVIVFVVTIILAMVDSSEWPGLFFYLTIGSVVILNTANGIYQNTIYGLAAKLPFKYTGAVVLGSNLSGTIVSIISIISLAMSPNPRTAAIYYFITALFILLACFDTYFALPLNRFFRYHDHMYTKALHEKKRRTVVHTMPYGLIFKQCFPQCFNVFFTYFVTLTLFPAVLADVHVAHDDFPISVRYFTPVVCFLTFNLSAVLGNLLPNLFCFPSPRWLFIPIMLRFLFLPFFLLCNFKPTGVERMWPTMMHWDYAFWAAVALFGLTGGYFSSLSMMYCPRSVETEYAPVAGMFGAASIVTGIFAGIGFSYLMPIIVSDPGLTFEAPDWWPTYIN